MDARSQADRLSQQTVCTFAAQAVPDTTVSGFEDVIRTMTNDPQDRQVLAAGIRGTAK